jgi:hypothetical protein
LHFGPLLRILVSLELGALPRIIGSFSPSFSRSLIENRYYSPSNVFKNTDGWLGFFCFFLNNQVVVVVLHLVTAPLSARSSVVSAASVVTVDVVAVVAVDAEPLVAVDASLIVTLELADRTPLFLSYFVFGCRF